MLDDLLEKHRSDGNPTHIVVECVRELEQDAEAAQDAWERRKKDREENQTARETLKDMGVKEPTDKDVRKFRLLQECKWRCPYTLERFMQAEFDDLVIQRIVPPTGDPRRSAYLEAARSAMQGTQVEHMVPQAAIVCDEWFNVTVTRPATNTTKGDRTPYDFVLRDADKDRRKQLLENAELCFGKDSLKFKIFSSDNARSLIQERDKLQRTAYIARCLRYVCLLKFGWLSPEDRDPGHEKANDATRSYLVTNGGTTRRLRQAWNLDELLRETVSPEKWAGMTDVEKERALLQGARIPTEEWKKLDKAKQDDVLRARRTKNRQDVRHHALDAMVVACTLPWAANLTVWASGWCNLDTDDGSVSSVHCPIFGENDFGEGIYAAIEVKLSELKTALPKATSNTIKHYRSHERHKQVFEEQLYGLRATYGGKPLEKPVFIVAQKLSDLTPEALNPISKGKLIFSPKLREHIGSAWKTYTADTANWRRVLERTQSELETKKAEALEKRAKPTTIEGINKRLWRVSQWFKENPNAELWSELQEFLHKEKGAPQPKPVFPDDFIATLRHWLNDLSGRNGLRRGRRTLDHRQNRRDWFAENLAKVLGLSLHKGTRLPDTAWTQNEKGGWIAMSQKFVEPVSLRVDALGGKALTAEQLFTALAHLIKHRGPSEKVPWSKTIAEEQRDLDEKESVSDTIPADQVRAEFEKARKEFTLANANAPGFHPAHYLQQLGEERKLQRKRAWPRDLMEAEAAAILEAQANHHQKLKEEIEFVDVSGKSRKATVAEWLLHGNSSIKSVREGDAEMSFHVFDRNYPNRERAPFTFQAARIHNRKPGLDLVEPHDEFGRPRYVMSRERPEYGQWQVEVALLNFKVLDLTSLKKDKARVVPSAEALAELREIITRTGRLSVEDLQTWVKPYKEKGIYDLVKEQPALVGEGKGRGRFSSFGLQRATEIIRPLQAEHNAMSKLTPKSQRAKKKLKTPEDKADAYVRQYVNYTPKLRYAWKNPATQTTEPEPLPRALRRYILESRDASRVTSAPKSTRPSNANSRTRNGRWLTSRSNWRSCEKKRMGVRGTDNRHLAKRANQTGNPHGD